MYNKTTQGMKRLSFHWPTNPEKNHNPRILSFFSVVNPIMRAKPTNTRSLQTRF